MAVNWNEYLARYQSQRGGHFFCGLDSYFDSQLVLTQGEKTPLIILVDAVPAGRTENHAIRARALVKLNGEYSLLIRAKRLVGSGVKSVLSAVGAGEDYGYPEVTRDRLISTNNKSFTKLVLGDLNLRNALLANKDAVLRVGLSDRQDGWHVVEVSDHNFDGGLSGNSPWISDTMRKAQEAAYTKAENREGLMKAASEHFDRQLDGMLDVLRAACQAVTTWRM